MFINISTVTTTRKYSFKVGHDDDAELIKEYSLTTDSAADEAFLKNWHHLLVFSDSHRFYYYIDGVKVKEIEINQEEANKSILEDICFGATFCNADSEVVYLPANYQRLEVHDGKNFNIENFLEFRKHFNPIKSIESLFR